MRPSHPRSAVCCARAVASEVLNDEIEATTGARLPTARTHARTLVSLSSKLSVEPAPSEPSATIPVHPLSSSQRQCSATKPWSTPRDLSKQVVIAGITPRHFILPLLGRPGWARRSVQSLCFLRAPQIAAAEPTRYSSEAGTRLPHHKRVPGTDPYHSACATWPRASSGTWRPGERSRLRSGTAKYPGTVVFSTPRAKRKLVAGQLRTRDGGHEAGAAAEPLGACPWRQERRSGLPRAQDRLRQCQWVHPRNRHSAQKSVVHRRPKLRHRVVRIPEARPAPCWGPDENRKQDSRTRPRTGDPPAATRLPSLFQHPSLRPASSQGDTGRRQAAT